MKKLLILIVYGLTILLISCKNGNIEKSLTDNKVFNQKLADDLEQIRQIDQRAANIPKGRDKKLSEQEWTLIQDSLHKSNQKRVKEIFSQYGYLGNDVVGTRGSQSFWLVVQHADNDPEFQKDVLEKMLPEVKKGNADPKSYGYLVDRVRLNHGNKQLYGTQVKYDWEICQAYPKPLEDPINVNDRRQKIGLEPLEVYLNEMSQIHYDSNKGNFKLRGLNGPTLYKTK